MFHCYVALTKLTILNCNNNIYVRKKESPLQIISICTPIICKNPLKLVLSLRNILLQFVSGAFGCNIYFLFEKQAFNGLIKVIGL